MKSLIFSVFILFISTFTFAQESGYEKRMNKYRSGWESLIPTHFKVQYAGSMGVVSLGTGWDYGKRNQWETDIIVGYLPKYSSKHSKIVFTAKQNFIPWNHPLGTKGFFFQPLTCGLYVSTISGREFWGSEPDKYPSGYYNFSTKVRINIYVGERITLHIPEEKRLGFDAVSFFYEISTCDLYLISGVQNRTLNPSDYLKLSFGLKFQFF